MSVIEKLREEYTRVRAERTNEKAYAQRQFLDGVANGLMIAIELLTGEQGTVGHNN